MYIELQYDKKNWVAIVIDHTMIPDAGSEHVR